MSASAFTRGRRALLGKSPIRNAVLAVAGMSWLDMKVDRWRSNRNNVMGTTHLKRIVEVPRENWMAKTSDNGLTFSALPGVSWGHASTVICALLPTGLCRWLGFQDPYWNESASYQVSEEGMWRIEKASFELHSLILEAVDEVIQSDYLLESFGIPRELYPAIRKSWQNRESDLMGRFDFLWDGEGEPKLAEYNADTPTVLIESAAAQRDWHREKRPAYGQFNVLDAAIRDAFQNIAEEQLQSGLSPSIVLAAQGASFWADPATSSGWRKWLGLAVDSIGSNYCFQEEASTALYLYKLAVAATSHLAATTTPPKLIEFDSLQPEDLALPEKGALWKLYPWEWLIYEDVGVGLHFHEAMDNKSEHLHRRILEPPWKLVASSKAMLAYLWRKHPRHPNLLPAAMADELIAVDGNEGVSNWVAKPALGREGTGLQYGVDSGAKTLKDFTELARSAGQVLVLPQAPPPPTPASYFLKDHSVPSLVGRMLKNAMEASPLEQIKSWHHGPVDTKPEEHKLLLHLGPPVIQEYYEVASMHGRQVVTSAWIVRGIPVAACFREDTEKTTNNNSCFVPHFVEPTQSAPASTLAVQEGRCICPPRRFYMTENQRKVRTELYGEGEVSSAGYRDTGLEQTPDSPDYFHSSRIASTACYGARGYAGRGTSVTGGGKRGSSGAGRRGKPPASVSRQEWERYRARMASFSSKEKARTGGHGHATVRGGRGYGG